MFNYFFFLVGENNKLCLRELLEYVRFFFFFFTVTEADGLKMYKSQTSENNRAPRGKIVF